MDKQIYGVKFYKLVSLTHTPGHVLATNIFGDYGLLSKLASLTTGVDNEMW